MTAEEGYWKIRSMARGEAQKKAETRNGIFDKERRFLSDPVMARVI